MQEMSTVIHRAIMQVAPTADFWEELVGNRTPGDDYGQRPA